MDKIAVSFKGEIWRRIGASPYSVSNMGRVKISLPGRPDMLRRSVRSAKLHTQSVAMLVAESFCDNPNGYTHIQHVNGDVKDNKASNIRWVQYYTALSGGAHRSGYGRGGFKVNEKFDLHPYGEDEEFNVPCIRCGTRDNAEPIRRGFCIECWCRILNHLGNGWDGMEPMLIDEALEWAAKAPMKVLRRMSRIDSGPIRSMDIPRDRELKKLRRREEEFGK